MAINFPNSPVNGDTYTFNAVTYVYSKSGTNEGYWRVALPSVSGVATVAEVDAGVNAVKYISPAGLEGSKYVSEAELINNLNIVYTFKTLKDFTDSYIVFPNGKMVVTSEYTEGNGGGASYIVTDASTVAAPDQYGDHYISHSTTQVAKIVNKRGVSSGTGEFYTEIDLAQYGMISNDDTQDWGLNLAAAMQAGSHILVRGNYFCNNIRFPNKGLRFVGLAGHWAGFTARPFGDSGYFAAPDLWLDNVPSVNQPVNFTNIFFNGKTKGITLVIRWFYAIHENLEIIDGIDHGILMTARSRDLTPPASSMVNNTFKNIEVSGTAKVGWEVSDDGKSTDWQIFGGYIHNGGDYNFKAKTLAGCVINGVHTYGSTINAEFHKMSNGTVITGCDFEGPVTLQGSFVNWEFGPKNTVLGELLLQQTLSNKMKSRGNTLSTIRQDVYGADKFTSKDDIFQNNNPISFTNNSAANTALIEVINADLPNSLYEQSGFLSPSTGRTDTSYLAKGDLPIKDHFTVGGSNSISQEVTILERADDESFSVDWSIGLRIGGTGSSVLSATYKWEVIKFSGTYYITTVLSDINAGSFSVGPDLSFTDLGGNLTITLNAEWTGSNVGIGNSSINIIDSIS